MEPIYCYEQRRPATVNCAGTLKSKVVSAEGLGKTENTAPAAGFAKALGGEYGAVPHLAGMKKSDFVVAIKTDKDAPIGDVANVFAGGYRFGPILLTNFPLQRILTLSGHS